MDGCCILDTLFWVLPYWADGWVLAGVACLETAAPPCCEGWVLVGCAVPPVLWADTAKTASVAIIVTISLFISVCFCCI